MKDADDLLIQELREAMSEEAPVRIAGYRVLEEIHRGAQGRVFRAEQLDTKRVVAIKVLLEGALSGDSSRRRFERELELVARLDHENIVTVHHGGVTEDGRHYFVMEYVDGLPLDRHLASHELSRDAIIELFTGICRGVSYGHQNGVIHRDLKPRNILIDSNGVPRLVDFGIAKDIAVDLAHGAELTATGAFLGTLAYASPEQVSGEEQGVDVRTDVYSLGVILYQALSGRFPYPVSSNLLETARAISEIDPERADEIDPELSTVLSKALAKERDRRYQSAGELGRDLEHYLRGEALDARRDSHLYLLRKSLRRYRIPVTLAGLLLVVLVAAGAISTAFFYDAAKENDRAARSFNLLKRMLVAAEHDLDGGGGPVTLVAALDWASQRVGTEFEQHPETELDVRELLIDAYRSLDAAPNAEPHRARTLVLRRELFGEEDLETAKALHHVARNFQKMLEADRYGFPPGEAYDKAERILLVSSAAPRALSADERTRLEQSLDHARAATTIRSREEGADSKRALSSLRVTGQLLNDLGRAEEAERAFREALVLVGEKTGKAGRERTRVLGELAVFLHQHERYDEAYETSKTLIELRDSGGLDVRVHACRARNNAAVVLRALGRVADARELSRTASTGAVESLGADDWRSIIYLRNSEELESLPE